MIERTSLADLNPIDQRAAKPTLQLDGPTGRIELILLDRALVDDLGLLQEVGRGRSDDSTAIYVPTGLVVMALRNASGEVIVEMVWVPSPTP